MIQEPLPPWPSRESILATLPPERRAEIEARAAALINEEYRRRSFLEGCKFLGFVVFGSLISLFLGISAAWLLFTALGSGPAIGSGFLVALAISYFSSRFLGDVFY
jgi:hypothetical protein